MDILSEIIKKSKLHKSRIFNVTVFGSRVYNNFSENSDWDVIIVANNSVDNIEIKDNLFNIHIYTPNKFINDLNWHKPNVLECFFAPDEFKLMNKIEFEFVLDKIKLRHSVSHVSSNSWVKAKKKIFQDEYHTGIKSIFHSLRIPMFATQVATKGTIYDFEVANPIWEKLISKEWTWEELDNEFRELRNSILTDFRKVCEK